MVSHAEFKSSTRKQFLLVTGRELDVRFSEHQEIRLSDVAGEAPLSSDDSECFLPLAATRLARAIIDSVPFSNLNWENLFSCMKRGEICCKVGKVFQLKQAKDGGLVFEFYKSEINLLNDRNVKLHFAAVCQEIARHLQTAEASKFKSLIDFAKLHPREMVLLTAAEMQRVPNGLDDAGTEETQVLYERFGVKKISRLTDQFQLYWSEFKASLEQVT